MNILINANVKKGGGLQVADSFIRELVNFPQHNYVVVLSAQLISYSNILDAKFPCNFKFIKNENENIISIITGRNKFLDSIVASERISVVFSIFGPVKWVPRVTHISGFAISHIIYTDSPFWEMLPPVKRCSQKIKEKFRKYFFCRTSNIYITENPDVSEKLKLIFPKKKIYTVTNFYNQIFECPNDWDRSVILPNFEGVTLLTITANYIHKNIQIIPKVCDYLRMNNPTFKFRFVLSINKEQIPDYSKYEDLIYCVGPVGIKQCPHLYQQSTFLFLPTLLECFSASYPEAMVMRKPILTSNLGFAKELCGDAAVYFDPMDAGQIARSIVELTENVDKQEELINNGLKQLKKYDTYKDRAKKYIDIIEENA